MPTKQQLQDIIEDLESDLRRANRALSQLAVDLPDKPRLPNEEKVVPNERVQVVLNRAEDEFQRYVTEPEYDGDYQRINAYIQGSEGLSWTWEEDYTRNGMFAWCGAFAAFCYSALASNIRKQIFPSCYRLSANWGSTKRHREAGDIQAGDIVVVYTSSKRSPAYGNHITLAIDTPDLNGNFGTIEGNAKGLSCHGTQVVGVIQRLRNIEDVAAVYRPLDEDYS